MFARTWRTVGCGWAAAWLVAASYGGVGIAAAAERPPNFVIVFTDDQGYADVGCFGAQGFTTPHLDRMAAEGIRFTDFYVAQAVCGASRAALLTGCYPNRLGLLGAPGPNATHGLHADEMTIAEVLKTRGYATAMFGKWHVGHREPFLPVQHGFDTYFGLPYSNDMWPFHPTAKFPDLPLIEGKQVVNPRVTAEDQTHLTTWYTERAVQFVQQNKDRPFLLYVAHAMPHVPLHVSPRFRGKSAQGLYGDVIMELDWSVGQILEALRQHELDDRTLVLFTTDNGPWLSYGHHAGSATPLREGKGTAWEGGVRVPCIMRWPGHIKAGAVCRELAATIDVLPTLAKLAGAALPPKKIDGRDIWPLMSGDPAARTPHAAYYYYWGQELHAVRSGTWKLHFPHPYRSLTGPPGQDGQPGGYSQRRCGLELYDLAGDVSETRDVAAQQPDVVARLTALAETMRDDLGDTLTHRTGQHVRAAGRWEAP